MSNTVKRTKPKASGPRRVYSFWAEPASVEDATRLLGQLSRHVDYRHELAAIENAGRAAIRALDSAEIVAKRTALVATLARFHKARDTVREAAIGEAFDAAVEEVRHAEEEADELRAELTKLYAAQRLDEARTAKRNEIRENVKAQIRAARAAVTVARTKTLPDGSEIAQPGLYWGTYLIAETAHEQAVKTTPLFKDIKFRADRREGSIAVQIQSQTGRPPFRVGDLVKRTNSLVRVGTERYALLGRVNGYRNGFGGDAFNKGGKLRPKRLTRVELRVGSNGREPIWCGFHVLFHREMPKDAVVKWVKVHRVRTGLTFRHQIQFTLDVSDVPAVSAPASNASCGIAISWRKVDGGVQIARAFGDDGFEEALVVGEHVVGRAAKSAELRKLRDTKRNDARKMLATWRKLKPGETSEFSILMDENDLRTVTLTGSGAENATWLRAQTESVHAWNRIGRFVSLYRQWADKRFPGDAAMFQIVEEWLIKDRHLYEWEAHNLRRMRLQINTQYEMWAAKLTDRFATVGVADLNLKAARERSDVLGTIAARVGQIVAPGRLIVLLQTAANKRGRTFMKVDAKSISKMCSECDYKFKYPDAEIDVTCPNCHVVQNRYRNAARNVLKRMSANDAVPSGAAPPVASPKSTKSKRVRPTKATRASSATQ